MVELILLPCQMRWLLVQMLPARHVVQQGSSYAVLPHQRLKPPGTAAGRKTRAPAGMGCSPPSVSRAPSSWLTIGI